LFENPDSRGLGTAKHQFAGAANILFIIVHGLRCDFCLPAFLGLFDVYFLGGVVVVVGFVAREKHQ
jgi:hypothetical protein